MNREAKQEIKRVLMGRTLIAEDGRLIAMEKGQLRLPMGVGDGAGAVRFLGVRKRACRLLVSCSKEKARSIAFSVMDNIGRGLYLPQQPEAAACLIRYVLTRPAVLVFDFMDDVPVLTAWSGRGLTGWISNRRAVRAFVNRMPKQMTLSEQPVPKDAEEEQAAAKKKAKKEAREAKKAAKKRKKGAQPEAAAEAAANNTNTEESQ